MTRPDGRTLVVTYCSRDKDPAGGLLPAVDRYLSPRIRATAEAAASRGYDFRILSGLHGLLAPDHPIENYDHLLTADQVKAHAVMVARDLEDLRPGRVVWLTRSPVEDPGCVPYGEVMQGACSRLGVEYSLREITAEVPEAADLAHLI